MDKELERLPKLTRAATVGGDSLDVVVFYEKPLQKHQSPYLYLSVHYFSPFFSEVEDTLEMPMTNSPMGKKRKVQYNSCAHYYHSRKFEILDATKEAETILGIVSAEDVVKKSKEIDHSLSGNPKWKDWEEQKVDVMRTAIRLKFEQHSNLLQKLLMTGSKILVEDNPLDSFWGGSLPGSLNVLGNLLMEFRDNVLKKRKVVPLAPDENETEETQYLQIRDAEKYQDNIDQTFEERLKELEAQTQYNTVEGTGEVVSPPDKLLSLPEKHIQEQLEKEICTIPPLMYLTEKQRKLLISESEIVCKLSKSWVIDMDKKTDDNSCFLIVEGEAHVFGRKKNFLELIRKGTFFGHDGALFGRRFFHVRAATKMTFLKIPEKTFEQFLTLDSIFTLSIARNFAVKHNVMRKLNKFKTFIRQCRQAQKIDAQQLIDRYLEIESSLHSLACSPQLDVDGWLYSIRRLPSNITSTFIFFISTKTPDILSHPDISMPVRTSARPRTIFRIVEGKCVVILRDLETDLFDFLSNLCIHIVESAKILRKLNSPLILKDLLKCGENQHATLSLLSTTSLTEAEVAGLTKIWPHKLGEHLANILLHYNDFYITISEPKSHLKADPIEKWATRLWLSVLELLKMSPTTACGAIPDSDIVVDLIQGSRRAFLNLVSPYIYAHRKEIMEWARTTKPTLITKKFLCAEDELYAYSHYYFLNHSEAKREKEEMEQQYGIMKIEQTELTGVMVTLVDCNKLEAELCDPALKPRKIAKNHIIINIGYTFGVQSSDIIRAIMNVFGKKLRTVNIIGKAGGLVGEKGDLLLSSRIHSDETFEVVNNNLGDLDPNELSKEAGKPVHVGPMLTVAGTIIQNSILLNYCKKLLHCVGLEMEGLPFAREIKRYTELKLIRADIVSRFAYYISDLPLNTGQTLAKEEGEINFDEGVPSLNAIYRHFTRKLFA